MYVLADNELFTSACVTQADQYLRLPLGASVPRGHGQQRGGWIVCLGKSACVRGTQTKHGSEKCGIISCYRTREPSGPVKVLFTSPSLAIPRSETRVMPPLFKCLLLSRGWKHLGCKNVSWILFSLSMFLGAAFSHFETMEVHNRNVQLTVKRSHQFRDHFQIWWMSSKYSIHSNHQAEKQLNSRGEKSR